MRRAFSPVLAGQAELVDIGQGHHEKLLAIKADVYPDGGATSFTVAYTNQRPFRVHVSIDEMGHILNAIQGASNLMVARSRLSLDRGQQRLLGLAATALRPVSTNVLTDPVTGDVLILTQFENHAPLCVRRSFMEARMLLVDLYDATRMAAH